MTTRDKADFDALWSLTLSANPPERLFNFSLVRANAEAFFELGKINGAAEARMDTLKNEDAERRDK